jgi:two-component system, OmpR family, phosphate regulon response regulator PhoB
MPPATKPLVLIVEDEADLVTLVTYNLEKNDFRVVSAPDVASGKAKAERERPDLILLDWMLPDGTGLDLCRELRKSNLVHNTPIIMLTARGEEPDKVRGLNAGADDYVTKPFSPAELVARINAVLRRADGGSKDEQISYADIEMDLVTHKAKRGASELDLGPTEFRLLRHFVQNPTRVYSREQLLDQVWGNDIYVEARTVDVHIRRLRKALGEPDLIRTVRAAGYAMDVKAQED